MITAHVLPFAAALLIAAPLLSGSEATPATFDCATVIEIEQPECEALVALYNSTDGANWKTKTGWLVTNTPCSWYGVISCDTRHVTELDLGVNQLVGTIPSELGDLAYLQNLTLDHNQLSGAIPPTLGDLVGLEGLWLDNCQLSEAIPPELGDLANLQTLYLDHNQLSGAIPPELGDLSKLMTLGLNDNQLTGTIPSNLGNLGSLVNLPLDNNQLTGTIPPELGNLSNLRSLELRVNPLGGALPRSLMSITPGPFPAFYHFTFQDTSLCEPPDPAFQAWLDAIPHMQSDNVLCTAQAITPDIARQANNVVLTWVHENPNTAYQIHRSTTPYFTPDGTTTQTEIPAPTNTYTDTGAISVADNYYYLVRSRWADGVNDLWADSDPLGKCNFDLVAGE